MEIAVPIGGGALRDSKNPDGGRVQLTSVELWTSFLCAIKAGRFDR